MPQVQHIQRTFAERARAQRYFETLQPNAWPYVWCVRDGKRGRWKVSALVERRPCNKVA